MTCVFFSVQFSLLINTTCITIKILTSQCNHANKTHKHILRHDSQLPSNMFQVVFASIITILHDERERERERATCCACCQERPLPIPSSSRPPLGTTPLVHSAMGGRPAASRLSCDPRRRERSVGFVATLRLGPSRLNLA